MGSESGAILISRHWLARPVVWLAMTFAILLLDFLTGPIVQLSLLMIIPVGLAAWHRGFKWGLALSAVAPLFRIGWLGFFLEPWPIWITLTNAAIRFLAMGTMAFFAGTAAKMSPEVRRFRDLLPICSSCKKIRNNSGLWEPVEQYVLEHSDARFTHSMCPNCAREYLPDAYRSPR